MHGGSIGPEMAAIRKAHKNGRLIKMQNKFWYRKLYSTTQCNHFPNNCLRNQFDAILPTPVTGKLFEFSTTLWILLLHKCPCRWYEPVSSLSNHRLNSRTTLFWNKSRRMITRRDAILHKLVYAFQRKKA